MIKVLAVFVSMLLRKGNEESESSEAKHWKLVCIKSRPSGVTPVKKISLRRTKIVHLKFCLREFDYGL